MRRSALVCILLLLAFAGVAYAQDEVTPPSEPTVPTEPAAPGESQTEEGLPPAEEQTPAPPVSLADVIWNPSVDQLSAWISEGITAAGADIDFFGIPILDRMTWSSLDGVPLVGNRSLRFAALMTPELTSYVVGYGASWDEDTWTAIQEDVDKVSNDLATSLSANVSGRPMYLTVAVFGPLYSDMMGAVYYEGQWHTLDLKPWGTISDYTPDSLDAATADPQWAAKYVLAQVSAEPALQPPDQVRVYLCPWNKDASTQVDADFLAELPAPEWTTPKKARLAVGNADLLAWVDFDMVL